MAFAPAFFSAFHDINNTVSFLNAPELSEDELDQDDVSLPSGCFERQLELELTGKSDSQWAKPQN